MKAATAITLTSSLLSLALLAGQVTALPIHAIAEVQPAAREPAHFKAEVILPTEGQKVSWAADDASSKGTIKAGKRGWRRPFMHAVSSVAIKSYIPREAADTSIKQQQTASDTVVSAEPAGHVTRHWGNVSTTVGSANGETSSRAVRPLRRWSIINIPVGVPFGQSSGGDKTAVTDISAEQIKPTFSSSSGCKVGTDCTTPSALQHRQNTDIDAVFTPNQGVKADIAIEQDAAVKPDWTEDSEKRAGGSHDHTPGELVTPPFTSDPGCRGSVYSCGPGGHGRRQDTVVKADTIRDSA